MEGSILSRFQLDMGLSNDSDSNPDFSPGESWGNQNEEVSSLERTSSNDELEEAFPFTSAQCRARSLSDEGQVPERELKRRKEFAEKTCKEKGIALDVLAEFSQMRQAYMLIEVQASILALQKQREKEETQKYLASDEFTQILKERLRCCLLSPNLTCYVIGTASKILRYAKENAATFKLPEIAILDPEMLVIVGSMIGGLLTSQRSNMKQKLINSMKSQNHISQLARTLAPGIHFEITLMHWARYSFLRSSMVTFNHLVDEGRLATVTRNQSLSNMNTDSNGANRPGAGEPAGASGTAIADEVSAQTGANGGERMWSSGEFWEFVDTLLGQTRVAAAAQESTIQGQQKFLEAMFMKCLQADMKLFPPNPSQSSTPSSEKVTLPWLRDINNGLIWTGP